MPRLGGVDPTKINIKKYKIGDPEIYIASTTEDIAKADCGNRAACVLEIATDRQFGLKGTGYVRVDARGVKITDRNKRVRHLYASSSISPMDYLRRFDALGEQRGVEYARAHTLPRAFKYILVKTTPIERSKTPEEKAAINRARNERNKKLRAQGLYKYPQKRYTGI